MMLRLINPLPTALHHYQVALCETLAVAGLTDVVITEASVESGSKGLVRRARGHVSALASSRSDDATLLLWPSFGYGEVLLDALVNPRLTVVFHDASSLRRQFGMRPWHGRFVGRIPRVTQSGRVVVHTQLAQRVLEDLGWDSPVILPLPLRPTRVWSTPTAPLGRRLRCLVLGQYKPSRDIALLESLPGLLPEWNFRAIGRDWPPLTGWQVEPTFVSESRVHDELCAADVVLIPYRQFYQSGVLVQAFELGKPVVTIQHEQTSSLFGDDWTGVAPEWAAEEVAAALVRAARVEMVELRGRVLSAQERSVAAWSAWARALLTRRGATRYSWN